MYCLYNIFYKKFNSFYLLKSLKFKQVDFNYSYSFNSISSFFFINKYFGFHNIVNKNSFNYLFKYNKKYYYDFNKLNNIFFKKIFNILSTLFKNGYNALILDHSYKSIVPIYNCIFGIKNLYSNKDFFFIDKKNFTRSGWIYFCKNKIKFFKVNLLVLLDYFYYKNFLTFLKRFNLPIITIVPSNIKNVYVDYYIYMNYINLTLSKFFFINFFSNIFFKYNFIYTFKLKNSYINKLNSFIKKIN